VVFIPALVGLGDVAVFLVAIVVIYALTLLVMAITGVLRYVPVVGPWIQDNLVSHVGDGLSYAGSWAVARLGDGIGLIWTPITWVAALFGRIGEALFEGTQAVSRVVTQSIPAAEARAGQYAGQLYHQAIGYVDATAGRLAQFSTDLYHGSIAFTQQEVGAAEAQAQQLYHQAIAYTQQEAGTLAQFSTDLYHGSIAFTQQQVGAAEQWVTQTVGTLQQDLLGRIGTTERWVQQEVGVLGQEITGAYDAATRYAAQVAQLAVAPALAGVAAVDLALTKYLEECGTNLCRGLNPLSTALQGLEALVEGGLIFALVAAAAADPVGTAREVDAVIGGTVAAAAGVARSAVGMAA
jgi:hypothetical protein